MNPQWVAGYEDHEYPVKDRSRKVAKQRGRMKVNGRALKRLLIERANKAQHSPKGGERLESPSHD